MKQAIVLMLILGALIAAAVAVLEIPGKTKPQVMSMTVEQIDQILRDHATKIKRSGNVWQFDVMGVYMACIVDPAHDRMRVVAPIARVSELEAGQEAAMLEANFRTMLDVRYATSDGIVYAAFIHPLSPLHGGEFVSALQQAARAALTFGGTYTSSDLVFGAQPAP